MTGVKASNRFLQEIRGRNEVGIEDSNKLAGSHSQTVLERTGFETTTVGPANMLQPDPSGPMSHQGSGDNLASIVS